MVARKFSISSTFLQFFFQKCIKCNPTYCIYSFFLFYRLQQVLPHSHNVIPLRAHCALFVCTNSVNNMCGLFVVQRRLPGQPTVWVHVAVDGTQLRLVHALWRVMEYVRSRHLSWRRKRRKRLVATFHVIFYSIVLNEFKSLFSKMG